MSEYRQIITNSEAKLLIVTPLAPGHRISKITRKQIKRNETFFDWVTYESDNNVAKNASLAFERYRQTKDRLPKYIIKIDNDINPQRGMLDKMIQVLEGSPNNVAYAFCSFKFVKGDSQEIPFPAVPFNRDRLLEHNYISSNSMIKIDKLNEVDGFVVDDKYKRLLDWALWLKFLQHGYVGRPVFDTSFTADLKDGSVSSGSGDDYALKRKRVLDDFVVGQLGSKKFGGNM